LAASGEGTYNRSMAYQDLREFVAALEQAGELRRVACSVSPVLEMTEIVRRLQKTGGGPGVLFEKPTGYDIPVLMNAFGTDRRMAMALGVESCDEIAQRIRSLLEFEPPQSLMGKIAALPQLAELASWAPTMVSKAPCQEVVEEQPSFARLPVIKCWPEDGGPFLTLPVVVTRSPTTGKRNVGMYRMQIYDERTAAMHWHIHKHGAEHFRELPGGERRLPAAVCLGGDPATIYASTAPVPYGFDEFLFAGFIRKQGVELVKCKTLDLEVPARSEIVLEGYVDADDLRMEGPFGDHTGFYSPPALYPTFHLRCMTRRANPIYPAVVVGQPPMEDGAIGKATERIFLPLIQMQLPEVVDLNLPVFGIFNNLAIVSIRKSYPGQARKVVHALWGMGQMMLTKIIVVVDEEVNVHDLEEAGWWATTNIDPQRDVFFVEGPVDSLDHAAPEQDFGSKMGIDATRKLPEEGHKRGWPQRARMSEEIVETVTRRWKEYGLE